MEADGVCASSDCTNPTNAYDCSETNLCSQTWNGTYASINVKGGKILQVKRTSSVTDLGTITAVELFIRYKWSATPTYNAGSCEGITASPGCASSSTITLGSETAFTVMSLDVISTFPTWASLENAEIKVYGTSGHGETTEVHVDEIWFRVTYTGEITGYEDRNLSLDISLQDYADRSLTLEIELTDYADRSLTLDINFLGYEDRSLTQK